MAQLACLFMFVVSSDLFLWFGFDVASVAVDVAVIHIFYMLAVV